MASGDSEAVARKFVFPTDRETFKQLAAQAALDLLRRRLLKDTTGHSERNRGTP
jgi:hypothetical protein